MGLRSALISRAVIVVVVLPSPTMLAGAADRVRLSALKLTLAVLVRRFP